MNRDNLIDSLGRIDDDMIQGVEALRQKRKRPTWTRWVALAACFCLILAAMAVAPRLFPGTTPLPNEQNDFPLQTNPDPSEGTAYTEAPRSSWTAYYNEAASMLSANRAYIKGIFSEELNEKELAALKPERWFEWMDCSGYAVFDNYGKLLDVIMSVTTNIPESPVSIVLTDYRSGACYVLPGEAMISVCDNVEYRLYQYEHGSTVTLGADAVIAGIYFDFAMETTQERLEQAKVDFQAVLECFASFMEGKPDLSIIVAEEIPELMEQIFETLSEAQAEQDFGRYLPSELPDGFEESDIYRFRFQDSNYLSGLWSKGLDDLNWVVSPYTEADAHRLTGVEDRENYDLSLYPIPRADSVPEELREIVDNPIFEAEELTLETVYSRAYKVKDSGDTDGWRMRFSVRYGETIVSISSKGVEPEWLYQQLVNLISE